MAKSLHRLFRIGAVVGVAFALVNAPGARAGSLLDVELPVQALPSGLAQASATAGSLASLPTVRLEPLSHAPSGPKWARYTLEAYQSEGFAHRVGFQLEALSAYGASMSHAVFLDDHPLFDMLSHSIERSSIRAAKHALGDVLLEATALDRTVKDIRDKRPDRRNGRVDWKFGFRSMLPKVELRYRLDRTSLGFTVDRNGLGLSLQNRRLGRNEVRARVRDADELSLSWAKSF